MSLREKTQGFLTDKNKAIGSVVGGFIVMLFLGSIYITGNISAYIQSYLNMKGGNVDSSKIFLLLPGIVICMTITFPIGSYISKIYHPRLVLGIGCSIGLACTFFCSFVTHFWAFFLLYSVGLGTCTGLAYGIPIYNSWKHFPEKKGLVTGIVLCGFGLASFVFGLTSKALVNPNGVSTVNGAYPDDIAKNVPYMMRMLTLIWLILSVIGVALTFPPPAIKVEDHLDQGKHDDEITQEGDNNNASKFARKISLDIQQHDETITLIDEDLSKKKPQRSLLTQCLLSRQFLLIYLMNILSIFIGFFIANTYKSFATDIINNESFLTFVGSLSGVFGGIRFMWAPLIDRFSYKIVYGGILLLQILLAFTITFVVEYKYLYMLYVCMIYWCEGGHFTLVPTMISKLFGNQATMVYGFGFSFCGISQVFSSILVTFFLDDLSYEFFYYLGGIMSAIALGILILAFQDKKFM